MIISPVTVSDSPVTLHISQNSVFVNPVTVFLLLLWPVFSVIVACFSVTGMIPPVARLFLPVNSHYSSISVANYHVTDLHQCHTIPGGNDRFLTDGHWKCVSVEGRAVEAPDH